MTYEEFYKEMSTVPGDAAAIKAVDCAQQAQALSIPFDMTEGSSFNAFMNACSANAGKGACAPGGQWDVKTSKCVPFGAPIVAPVKALTVSWYSTTGGKVGITAAAALAVAGIWLATRRKATPNRRRAHRSRR